VVGNARTYGLIPAGSFFVRSSGPRIITELDFVKFGKILLMSGCATKVAFAAVMCDGFVETARGSLGIILLVSL
jgi:hypothetical protein